MGSQLLTLAACAKLPVLALFDSETEARQARQQVDGITDYLLKPVRYEAVQQALARRLLTGEGGKSAGL
jgi:CheY-like chemotaxis protein